MPESFSFNLDSANIKKAKGSIPWQMKAAVAALSIAVLVLGYLLVAAKTQKHKDYMVPELGKDTEVAVITHKANEFLSRYLSFSVAQTPEHQKALVAMMTPDYANAYQIVWQDPTLTAAMKAREASVSVSLDEPAMKQVDEQGRIYVNAAGRVKVSSEKTYIASQERYFACTVIFVKTSDGLRVANVVWRNAQ